MSRGENDFIAERTLSRLMLSRSPANKEPCDSTPCCLIQDVATAAAVSIATVSRVLNTPQMVSPSTAIRVQKVIAELGYRPNVFAQGLVTRKSRVLGIALPDIHGEFYSRSFAAPTRRPVGWASTCSSAPSRASRQIRWPPPPRSAASAMHSASWTASPSWSPSPTRRCGRRP